MRTAMCTHHAQCREQDRYEEVKVDYKPVHKQDGKATPDINQCSGKKKQTNVVERWRSREVPVMPFELSDRNHKGISLRMIWGELSGREKKQVSKP